ncbi:hypothetical protein C8Q73DRAFT_490570 [Cubamyces lactineus]|nr:hypothetical protein C8Q73DRAFT_490570 [Cubamyces lactineus]
MRLHSPRPPSFDNRGTRERCSTFPTRAPLRTLYSAVASSIRSMDLRITEHQPLSPGVADHDRLCLPFTSSMHRARGVSTRRLGWSSSPLTSIAGAAYLVPRQSWNLSLRVASRLEVGHFFARRSPLMTNRDRVTSVFITAQPHAGDTKGIMELPASFASQK